MKVLERVRGAARWIAERLKDLLYSPDNAHLDVGRATALLALGSLLSAAAWNAHLRQPIDLGPAGLGGGLAGVLTAAVIYIYKDRSSGQ